MPTLTAYLNFDRNCAAAMKFYAEVLGAKIDKMFTYGDSPMAGECGPGEAELVMHAHLVHPQFALMGGDATSGMPYKGVEGVNMTLNYDSAAEAKKVFDALSAGGKVTMPMAESFWADAFGMFTDRYGVPWIVNGGMREVPKS
jgi:PhnB protein